MKYTIPSIDQRAALALGDVDVTDCHLLQWLFYFCNGKSDKLERTEHGTWVNYEFLSAEMPLLGLERDAVGRRMRELQDKGYIKLFTNRGVRKTYVDLTEKIERLFGDEPTNANQLAASQRMHVSRPTNRDKLAQGRANESKSANQSYYNPSHKLSGKTDHKSSSAPHPDVDRSDEANPTKVAMRKARELGLKPWEASKQSNILRRDDNNSHQVESNKDPLKPQKPVKSTRKRVKRAGRVQHADSQLATALM